MRTIVLVTTLALGISAGPASAAEQDCFQQRDTRLRIKGCSDLIERNPKHAVAYHKRAEAHSAAGDLDRAIADYSKAIEIKPDTATAFDGRARAYAAKGDYVKAVPDATRARELRAAASARPTVAVARPAQPKAAVAPRKTAKAAAPTVPPTAPVNDPVHDWPRWAKFKDSESN